MMSFFTSLCVKMLLRTFRCQKITDWYAELWYGREGGCDPSSRTYRQLAGVRIGWLLACNVSNDAAQTLFLVSRYASTNNRRRRYCVLRSSIRPSVNTYCAWRHIFALSGDISVKHDRNVHRASWNCWKGFGHRSQVKIITRPSALFPQKDSHPLAAVRPLCAWRRH